MKLVDCLECEYARGGQPTQDAAAQGTGTDGSRGHEPVSANAGHLAALSALLELNTGLPLALDAGELEALPPEQRLRLFQDRFADHLPEVDSRMLERIVEQYPTQVKAQNAYRIRPYQGRVVLVEPRTRYAGLIDLLLASYVGTLDASILELGEPDARTLEIAGRFGALASHYRCMRDETFTTALAGKIDQVL